MIAALALVICSQHSTVSLVAVRPLRISVASDRSSSDSSSGANSVQAKNLTELLTNRQATGDAKKNEIFAKSKAAVEDENSHAKVQHSDVTPTLLVPVTRWQHPRFDHDVTGDLPDGVQSDGRDPRSIDRDRPPHSSRNSLPLPLPAPPDTNGGPQHTTRVLYSEVLDDPVKGLPKIESLDTDLRIIPLDSRFLTMNLMDDPEPPEIISECSSGKAKSAVVQTYVDAFDDEGCASCELDDEGNPIIDYVDDSSAQVRSLSVGVEISLKTCLIIIGIRTLNLRIWMA